MFVSESVSESVSVFERYSNIFTYIKGNIEKGISTRG